MNTRQTIVLWAGAIIIALMILFPPMRCYYNPDHPIWGIQYAPIWTRPVGTSPGIIYRAPIDLYRLVPQIFGVCLLTALGAYTLRD